MNFKRSIAVVLTFILCLSTLTGLGKNASAAGEEDQALLIGFPRAGDANPENWVHGELHFMNGWVSPEVRKYSVYTIGSYTGNICYCIEPGTPLSPGDSFTQNKDESFWDNYPSDYNHTIRADMIKIFIGRILQYGYTGTVSPYWVSQNPEEANCIAEVIATQLLIWETIVGERDSDFNHVSSGEYDAVLDCISDAHPLRNKILGYYNSIAASVQSHGKVPSFCTRSTGAKVYELEWNGSEYTTTLTDSNNVLGNYTFSADNANVKCSVKGNQLTLTASSAPSAPITITASKTTGSRKGLIVWSDGIYKPSEGLQDLVSYTQSITDPVSGFIKVKVSYGSAKIVKTSEDGKVDGVSFHIQGNGIDTIVQTKNGGQIQIDNLTPGVYTVTELTEEKYAPQEVRRVTVVSGQTATVTFSNVLKRGDLAVTKTSEDGLSEGAKFHLYGTSLSGLAVDEYAVADSTGVATFEDVLIGTGYTLEEMDTAIRYVVPEKQAAAIEWNKVTNKSFDNILKKWQITVTKSDSETGTAQGNVSLGGAVYGIFKGDQLVDTYTTDTNGQFITKFYICDSDWSLRELSASEGYLVTSGSEHIGAEPKLYTVEYNSTALDVLETVQKGKIAVIKHRDDGETQIETPEAGAEFEVFLKSSGSYDAAKDSERDILVCDKFGFAESKDLPYGIYTVKQTKGWEGNELMEPFDVFVKEDGEIYRYLINNATFEALIEIVKKDIETGKVIPASGIGFKVRNTDTGKYIVQHINYPTPVDIDIYYTDRSGKLMMPEALPYGNYEIIEQNTCYGYVLDPSPVPFTVDGSKTTITVEKYNIAQKGTITVTKTGEVFASVVESGEIYQPVQGLAGAVYEVSAAEDVSTLDGTLRYSKGEVVAMIETDSTGIATTEPLYLGKFDVREIKAPDGMLVSDEVHSVELTYSGQEVEITETETAFYNERQRVQIDLAKIMVQDEKFEIGMNGEILSVQFGLFAAEDLTAADGSVIPADGLLEIVSCDENGKAAFITDVPVGAKLYVKEVATNEQYMLSAEKYPVTFEYAGQNVAAVNITVNKGEAIENDIIYGNIKGLKIDRETEETIAGALFGLFRADVTEFTEENAILTTESSVDGVFIFENVPFSNWIVKELVPAEGFLSNEELYPVTVSENEEIIEITVVNDRIPEIGTTATVDGEKEICATEIFTLTDTVTYKHLIPGKEYVLKGILMDKTSSKPLVIDGQEIHSIAVFTPEAPTGKVIVKFTFDSKYIKADTDIVVFERLYRDGKELAVHADIEDESQTVKVKVPKIGTQATAEREKEITTDGRVVIEDIVSYFNLTPDKEYMLKGILMDKTVNQPLLINGEEIRSSFTFKPQASSGEITVSFVFDAGSLMKETEIVVFETLYREGVEVAFHTDIEDQGQTVKIIPPTPPVSDNPQTGVNSNLGLWLGLGAVAAGGLIALCAIYWKQKKDDDDK